MGTRGDMGDAQRDFLKARGRCGANNACLTALYQARIATLNADAYGLTLPRGRSLLERATQM